METIRKKLFITGASSFLSGKLVNILKDNYDIILLEHRKPLDHQKEDGIKTVRGSLENISEWENNLSGVDAIIHLAGITHSKNVSLYKKINTEGTRGLIYASKKYGVKQFIFISTSAVGENCGAYGESKKEAEKILKESGLVYTILRVGPSYNDTFDGKEGLAGLVKFAQISPLLPYLNDNSVKFSPIHRDDVIKSITSTVNNKNSFLKTYTLSGPENLSTKEVFFRVLGVNKTKKLLVPIPMFVFKIIFYLFSGVIKKLVPDQMERMISKKEPLSANVLTDLGVVPRKFLI
jgi:nucleoside-diphosphate-sugar epimerase